MEVGDTVITPEGKGILVTIERYSRVKLVRYCVELEATGEVRCFEEGEIKVKK